MSYKQIKWAILLLPTLIVFLWEELRHTYHMLHYIPMHVGNWLTPVIVFTMTMLIARKLFDLLERIQKQLEEERTKKVILQEREQIARQLHDGIAQSLFLLSVKLNKIEGQEPHLKDKLDYQKVKKTVQHIHQDVRQSIYNLRNSTSLGMEPLTWKESLRELVRDFQEETGLVVHFQWELPEERLSPKEKVELYACIKEALMNAHKHAKCKHIVLRATTTSKGWMCVIEDDGFGFIELEQKQYSNGHGIDIMRDRANEMNWELQFGREENKTKVIIVSEN